MERVKVYGKEQCVQCDATKKHLKKKDIPFDYVDVTVDEIAYQEAKSLGYSGVPVVRFGDKHFQGFRPDRLNEFKQ